MPLKKFPQNASGGYFLVTAVIDPLGGKNSPGVASLITVGEVESRTVVRNKVSSGWQVESLERRCLFSAGIHSFDDSNQVGIPDFGTILSDGADNVYSLYSNGSWAHMLGRLNITTGATDIHFFPQTVANIIDFQTDGTGSLFFLGTGDTGYPNLLPPGLWKCDYLNNRWSLLSSLGELSGEFSQIGVDAAGDVFGTLAHGGLAGTGSIWELPADSTTITRVADFPASLTPSLGSLIIDRDNNIFGLIKAPHALGKPQPLPHSQDVLWELPARSKTVTQVAAFDSGVSKIADDHLGHLIIAAPEQGHAHIFSYDIATQQVTDRCRIFITPDSMTTGRSGEVYFTCSTGTEGVYELPKDGTGLRLLGQVEKASTSHYDAPLAIPVSNVVADSQGNLVGFAMYKGGDLYTAYEIQGPITIPPVPHLKITVTARPTLNDPYVSGVVEVVDNTGNLVATDNSIVRISVENRDSNEVVPPADSVLLQVVDGKAVFTRWKVQPTYDLVNYLPVGSDPDAFLDIVTTDGDDTYDVSTPFTLSGIDLIQTANVEPVIARTTIPSISFSSRPFKNKSIQIKWTNNTSSAESFSSVSVYASTDAAISTTDYLIEKLPILFTLQPGQTISQRILVNNISTDLDRKQYFLLVRASASDVLVSQTAAAGRINLTSPKTLIIAEVQATTIPIAIHSEQKIAGDVTISVTNYGTVDFSGSAKFAFNFSPDGSTLGSTLTLAVKTRAIHLKVGESKSLAFKIKSADPIPIGNYTIKCLVFNHRNQEIDIDSDVSTARLFNDSAPLSLPGFHPVE